jgi:hypothetical protein
MTDQLITESSCTAVVKAPIEFVDVSTWLFNLPDAEYQRCSPAHIAAAATMTDDGRRMSINVETIGGSLMVQNYVEDIGKKDHCRVLSTSDVLTPSGWTKIKVIWEPSVKAIDKDSCELTNQVIGSSTPDETAGPSSAGAASTRELNVRMPSLTAAVKMKQATTSRTEEIVAEAKRIIDARLAP